MGNLFSGQTQVPYPYSRFGNTRNNGKTFHGGQDVVGLNSTTILMPDYNGKPIKGTVISSTIVPKSSGDKTWEWGYYVCVKLHANQTPDVVNYLYFAHNEKNLVKVGAVVESGDPLAIMGNTGNAVLNNPPYKHCHVEARATRTGRGVSPVAYTGCSNAVGVYGKPIESVIKATATPLVDGLMVRPFPVADDENGNTSIDALKKGEKYDVKQTRQGWAFLMTGKNSGGWVCIKSPTAEYLRIEVKE